MDGISANFDVEVLKLLSQLKAKKEKLQEQYTNELAAVDREIEAVSVTARLLRQAPAGLVSVSITQSRTIIPTNLSGKTVEKACMEIAKKNDGIVRVKEAKDALIAADVLRRTKNSWGVVNTTLNRSNQFEKHGSVRGAYRLMNAEDRQGKLPAA
jgi:hypothetical protein